MMTQIRNYKKFQKFSPTISKFKRILKRLYLEIIFLKSKKLMKKKLIFLKKHKIQEDLKFLKKLQPVMKMTSDLFNYLKNS